MSTEPDLEIGLIKSYTPSSTPIVEPRLLILSMIVSLATDRLERPMSEPKTHVWRIDYVHSLVILLWVEI